MYSQGLATTHLLLLTPLLVLVGGAGAMGTKVELRLEELESEEATEGRLIRFEPPLDG